MRKFLKSGDVFIWLSGAALAFCLILVAALLTSIFVNATTFFWPDSIVRIGLKDGSIVLGQETAREKIPQAMSVREGKKQGYRIQIKRGNRDIYGSDFIWIDEDQIQSRQYPENALLIERLEWGDFLGNIKLVRDRGKVLAEGSEAGLNEVRSRLPSELAINDQIGRIEKKEIGKINFHMEKLRLKIKALEGEADALPSQMSALQKEVLEWKKLYKEKETLLIDLRKKRSIEVVIVTIDGKEKSLPLYKVLRVHSPNEFSFFDKIGYFTVKVWDFIFGEPREANTEGGVFPAIFGTVMMVMLMSLFATPLGILAAIYLREYAKQGTMISVVRIAVNNLAGVPSIVFGVFGVGFFIYFVGGTIDSLFFEEALPTPTFGTGGILWASLTMALMTVPVVIVSTEEGLDSVSGGIREASYALGATKFETTWKVVLPAVMPSILTGLILAMARAAGEVAPLMITGVVKLAPSLPMDGLWPFVHLERKFMHLGFHIYDVGFQSPNVDAARPMVFATTLLLILIVIMLNIVAIILRNRLRRKLSAAGF
jgi:phosphate transport system permease protein